MRWTHKTKDELIAEIKKLKKELSVVESNEKSEALQKGSDLQTTVESLNLVGFILETDGSISYVNTFALRVLGWSSDELIGENFLINFS